MGPRIDRVGLFAPTVGGQVGPTADLARLLPFVAPLSNQPDPFRALPQRPPWHEARPLHGISRPA